MGQLVGEMQMDGPQWETMTPILHLDQRLKKLIPKEGQAIPSLIMTRCILQTVKMEGITEKFQTTEAQANIVFVKLSIRLTRT